MRGGAAPGREPPTGIGHSSVSHLESAIGIETAAPASDGPEAEDFSASMNPVSLPPSQVHDLFVTLQKALRAYQLYDENNPVYQRFVSNLKKALAEIWLDVDELRIQVEEFRLLWFDEAVYENDTRTESLAFLFFKDGVREIRLKEGLEHAETEALLRALQRARTLRPEGEDLLTILWDEDLQYFEYQYVDMLAEGVEVPEPGPGNDLTEAWQEEADPDAAERDTAAESSSEPAQPPKPKVSHEDFSPTLYSLDPRELEQLQRELEVEMGRDLRSSVLAALFDRVEEPERPDRQVRVLEIFHTLLPNFLSRGLLGAAAAVLAEIQALAGHPDVLDAAGKAKANEVLDEISGSEALEELVRALEDGTIDPAPRQLAELLQHLRGHALAILIKASEETPDKRLQSVLIEAIGHIARRSPGQVIQLLEADDPELLAGACRLAGHLGIGEAGAAVARLIGHQAHPVRLAAVEASVQLKASTAAAALERALGDEERDVRIAAAKGLGELEYRPAAATLKQRVSSRAIRQADISEKVAVFESYGAIGGTEAVALLGKLLTKKGLLGRRESDEIRASAALGLGRAGTAEAREFLKIAQTTSEPVVKSAVSRALRSIEP